MSFQGIALTPEMRKLAINAKKFFDQSKKNPEIFSNRSTFLTASALGISESTVKIIMASFNKSGEESLLWNKSKFRGRPPFSVNAGLETIIRTFVRDGNKNGRQITIDVIGKYLQEILQREISPTTLWRTLNRWGFEFGKGVRSAQLKESERVIIQRRCYLRDKIANRNADGTTIRPEIYLDESYINKNHSRDDTWFFSENSPIIAKPTGKGDRLIIVNAINSGGWVRNAKLVFKASKKTGDYHASMNWDVFREWFKNQLLKNIPKNSLIILDNAAYHNVLTEEAFPKRTHSMKALREWLTFNSIPWREDMLKAELYELCSRFSPKPEYELNRIAAEAGHSILRTPAYHPELQPIEICWAVVKNYVAKHNNFTMEKVQELLEEGFKKVTAHTVQGIMKKVREQEDMYWEEDTNNQNMASFDTNLG
jgi:transposase